MKAPDTLPEAVKAGIERYARQHCESLGVAAERLARELLEALRWDAMLGCYWFTRSNMFHGVELDGHIHT